VKTVGLWLPKRMRLVYGAILCSVTLVRGQTVQPDLDPNEKPGERPYEMVWAKRVEPADPTVTFDHLQGWTLQVADGAQATLQVTRTQNVWDRPVARLRYRGNGKSDSKASISLTLPEPVRLPDDADAVDLWVYGNRWSWENPPGTPSVHLILHLEDAQGAEHPLEVERVRWQEWWLVHKRLPASWKAPLRLRRIEVAGGWQPDWRDLFFDSIRGYHETLDPIPFSPRPQRNLTLFEGQSAGANTGEGKLPFPTREETILPMHWTTSFTNTIVQAPGKGTVAFQYRDPDCALTYYVDSVRGLSSLRAEFNGQPVGSLLWGAGVRLGQSSNAFHVETLQPPDPNRLVLADDQGTVLRLQIVRKSLVIDVINPTTRALGLDLGQITNAVEPRTIWVPYLNFGGGPHPCVLLSKAGAKPVFTSLWLDWYRSNGSELYAAELAANNCARINGGVRYLPRTDGRRNPLFERLFVTVSPIFEEVLPAVPNPIGLHAAEAVDRLWQESWGPDDYEKQMKRCERLRAYGIEKLIQCNHEIAWRDAGESFTLRLRAAPKKGGDEALRRYVSHQRGLGWLAGLYSNYTDFAPVNEFWSPDGVQRQPDGTWRTAWPRCYAEKPLKAVEFDAALAPRIKAKYDSNSAYTDVHTAVAPWSYTDYDARVPGAGTFAQTFYAYGELLRNDSKVYGGPIFSEGTYQWLYAGLADGNYALAYDARPLAKEPLLPVFDLYQIHPRECDIGMGWTAHFCDAIPDWHKPENIDRAVDRFLLHTLAYGHIGWLVEEEHGIERTCRSYYMLQQVQARYGLQAPTRIAYWDGTNLVSVSEALARDLPRTRRQLHVAYPKGLRLWFNDHPSENWTVPLAPGTHFDELVSSKPNGPGNTNVIVLPPAGWAALSEDGQLVSYSALAGTNRVDYLRSPAYTYLDGRGQWWDGPEAASNGALAIRRISPKELEVIHISGSGSFQIRRPYGMQGRVTECRALDAVGTTLKAPACNDTGSETRIEPVENAIRYSLTFSGLGKLERDL
jgi:hypothetical protein